MFCYLPVRIDGKSPEKSIEKTPHVGGFNVLCGRLAVSRKGEDPLVLLLSTQLLPLSQKNKQHK